uniref:Uncharacterized protein n=1 Tax=Rhizophora mucronata TaxID=61149 RepID=A0A2P2PC76_RHIMU
MQLSNYLWIGKFIFYKRNFGLCNCCVLHSKVEHNGCLKHNTKMTCNC